MEQNTSDETSCCSSSNVFTVKVVIAWLIICLPGNIFAIMCIYGTEDSDITSSHEKQSNFSDTAFINFSLRSHKNYSNFYWNQKFITRHLNLSTYVKEHDKNINTFKMDLENVSMIFISDLSIV